MVENIGHALIVLGSMYFIVVYNNPLLNLIAYISILIALFTWTTYSGSKEAIEKIKAETNYYNSQARYYDRKQK